MLCKDGSEVLVVEGHHPGSDETSQPSTGVQYPLICLEILGASYSELSYIPSLRGIGIGPSGCVQDVKDRAMLEMFTEHW